VEIVAREIEDCKLQSAANTVMSISRIGNQYLNEKEPWNLIKKDRAKAASVFYVAVQIVRSLAIVSAPFIPFAAEEMWNTLNLPESVHSQKWTEALNPLPANHKIGKSKPLFHKIDTDEKKLDEMLASARARLTKAN